MSSTINTTTIPMNMNMAEEKYLNSGKCDGNHRLIEAKASSADDFVKLLNENVTNMYARDFNLAKRGSFKPTPLRNWTSVSTNFEKWVFERIDDNMKRAMKETSSPIGACVIPKHYMIKNKVEAELEELMNILDIGSAFDTKIKEHFKSKYPTLDTNVEFKLIMGDKKNDMVMAVLTIMFIDEARV